MSSNPFSGAFPHQHHDPRGLVERIEAQLRDRIAEALDMAALELMVALRQRHGRPAPEGASEADRREFERLAAELLDDLHDAFHRELSAAERAELERAETSGRDLVEGLLAGQVFLARRLPDYWQRLEAHRAAHARIRLDAPPPRTGRLRRLFRD